MADTLTLYKLIVLKMLDFKSDVPEVNAEFGDMRKYVDEILMEI